MNNYSNNISKQRVYSKSFLKSLFFILLWPFGGYIYAIKNIRNKYSINLIYFWFLIFGIGFSAVNEGVDSYWYVTEFLDSVNLSYIQYKHQIIEYFTFQDNVKDIYFTTIAYFVSRFTTNYHILFLALALVFGYFYTRSLKYLISLDQCPNFLVFYALIFIFCFSNPIFNINGARFWTATWIGVWLMFKIFVDGKKYFLPFTLITCLIHGSFTLYVAFVISILFLNHKKLLNFWVLVFVASSFFTVMSFLHFVEKISEYLPKFLQNLLWYYTESDIAISRINEVGIASYGKFLRSLPLYFVNFLILLLFFNKKNFEIKSTYLVGMLLILSSIINFLSGVPSMGRFYALLYPFVTYLWLKEYVNLKHLNYVLYLTPVIYAYVIKDWLTNMISISDIYTYISPTPIVLIYNIL